jgi:hypothetical protein
MKRTKIFALFVFLGFVASMALMAAPEEVIDKSFAKKDEIRFKLVLGNCQLKKSSDGRIHVRLVYSYEPDMSYEPRMEERGDTLYLEEKLRGNNPKGHSDWTVEVPDDMEIEFKSATGDLTVMGLTLEIDGSSGTGNIELGQVKGEIDLSTGTGDVDAYDSEGEFELSSGTGNVEIKNCKGNFDASSGTGDVEAEGLTLVLDGEFSSGTGDAEVSYPEGTDFELRISSGTDSAILNMNGKRINGYFEFTCHKRKGRIVCPVDFDTEEEYEQDDQVYLKKSFIQGSDRPRIYIETGTGTAKLNK